MRSFGVFLQQERPIADLLHWAERFDEAGADSLFVADHLAPPSGEVRRHTPRAVVRILTVGFALPGISGAGIIRQARGGI